MKKLFSLLASVFVIAFIASCAGKQPEFTDKKPLKDDLSSLRKHLAFKDWIFLPLSPTETIVSFYDWGGRAKNTINVKNALKEYCEAQGGEFNFSADSGFCKGGNDPFTFETVRGYGKYYRSSGTYFYLYFTYVKTTKPDVELDYGFYDTQFINKVKLLKIDEFLKEYSGMAAPFSDLQKKNKDVYTFEVNTNNSTPPNEVTGRTFGGFWKLVEYCKAQNGELKKRVGSEDYMPFNIWMKEIFLKHSGMTYNSIANERFPLNGEYLCSSPNQPFKFFMYGVRVYQALGGFAVYKVKLIKLKPDQLSFEKNSIENRTGLSKTSNMEKVASEINALSMEDKMALDASAVKTQIIKREGPRIFRAAYAFPKDGCDYVVVMDGVPKMEPLHITTYKICSGKIAQKISTRVIEPLPDFIKPKLQDVINQAKLRGFAIYEDNYGYIAAARTLRPNDLCSLDVFVIHNGKTIYYKTVNACN